MTYRIFFIGTRHQLREMGVRHETLIQDLRTETWYEPKPGAKVIYGIPPWDKRGLWEVDAPFPPGANPPLEASDIHFVRCYDPRYYNLAWVNSDQAEQLRDFFSREFPNQLE